jgi:hypothetical protein
MAPTLIEKEAGVISLEGKDGAKYVNCRAGKGSLVDVEYRAGISIELQSSDTVAVTIVVDGDGKYSRRHHVFGVIPTNTNRRPTDCSSNGVFEHALFDFLGAQ